MTKTKCPGQDMRFWQPDDIFDVVCGKCGYSLEFFKDEAHRRCIICGNRVINPKLSFGCAQWCEHARECLGFDPQTLQREDPNEVSLIDKLIDEMKAVFDGDQKRITHALSVLANAEEIMRSQKADPRVVLTAAILHDIGILEAERKHGSSAGIYQEMEGPTIANPIMKKVGLDIETIRHVEKIIANHHSAKDIDTPEFRIIWDADWLVNLGETYPKTHREALKNKIERIFKTKAGKRIAYQTFCKTAV